MAQERWAAPMFSVEQSSPFRSALLSSYISVPDKAFHLSGIDVVLLQRWYFFGGSVIDSC